MVIPHLFCDVDSRADHPPACETIRDASLSIESVRQSSLLHTRTISNSRPAGQGMSSKTHP
jgi:hypothetical protein